MAGNFPEDKQLSLFPQPSAYEAISKLFKEIYSDKLASLIPKGTKLYPKSPGMYSQAVVLGIEHGVSYVNPKR
jgi:hypothetical protein